MTEQVIGWVDCPACGEPVLVQWSPAHCRTTIRHRGDAMRYEDIELGIKPGREEAALETAREWAGRLPHGGDVAATV